MLESALDGVNWLEFFGVLIKLDHFDLGLRLGFTFIIRRRTLHGIAVGSRGAQELNWASENLIAAAAGCKETGPELCGLGDQAQVVLADGVGVATRELDFLFQLDGRRARMIVVILVAQCGRTNDGVMFFAKDAILNLAVLREERNRIRFFLALGKTAQRLVLRRRSGYLSCQPRRERARAVVRRRNAIDKFRRFMLLADVYFCSTLQHLNFFCVALDWTIC